MGTYRHIDHAGNFADVAKHAILAMLVEALQRQSSAIYVVDGHAGVGRYDLGSQDAAGAGEWRQGIGRIYHAPDPPPDLKGYLEAVAALNEPGELRFYPGSPRIIRSLLRPQDRLLASELNSSEYARLEQEFFGDQQVDTRHQDAYDSVEAWLPPPHDGGLVLFDPTFQRGDECAQLIATLGHAYQRWPTGTFAAWYPITARGEPNQLRDAVGAHNMTKILTAELTVTASADAKQLTGCGMLLVNSPTDVDARLDSVLHWLWTQLSVDPDTGIELHRLAPSR